MSLVKESNLQQIALTKSKGWFILCIDRIFSIIYFIFVAVNIKKDAEEFDKYILVVALTVFRL